ncbi:MAG: tRNA dihydrouridine synthase DusB [Clostridia bacterium]|nr:tRNA dihydrouridine synthase DusB [Clostridia bacterium]
MKIRELEIKNGLFLAPMAGVTDSAYRRICKRNGAEFVTTELISGKAVCFGDKKTRTYASFHEEERPIAIQLFGSDSYHIAKAAYLLMDLEPDVIDINMGCPVPKAVKSGEGSALLKNPQLCAEILSAVKKEVNVPVTAKIRRGFEKDSDSGFEVALALENAGADAIFVHGRTAVQMYSGKADRGIIKKIKEAVSCPVIANGDISSPKDALSMLSETKCDGIMVGRACMGNPWIFKKIKSTLENREYIPPTEEEFKQTILEQISLMVENKGEYIAVREARKHLSWYTKGRYGSAALRDEINKVESAEKIISIIEKM